MRIPPSPADFTHAGVCKPFCEKYLTLPEEHRRLRCLQGGANCVCSMIKAPTAALAAGAFELTHILESVGG